MQRSKFFLSLFFVSVILSLVADHQVAAAPEPCIELLKLIRQRRKPTSTPPPKNPKKEKLKLFETLMEDFSPQWIVHIDQVTTQPPTATPTTQPTTPSVMDTYMAFFGYLFSIM
ncbi:uncharacterized protein [Epargyreus clarus]|uniref:uncharacterized protein n=1 Tax=Epargyreus clarus TaxID=520877 RepID=UPI003C2E3A4B